MGIFESTEIGNQIEGLKDHTDMVCSDVVERSRAQLVVLKVFERNGARL